MEEQTTTCSCSYSKQMTTDCFSHSFISTEKTTSWWMPLPTWFSNYNKQSWMFFQLFLVISSHLFLDPRDRQWNSWQQKYRQRIKGWWGGVSKRGLIQWGTGGQVREDCMSGESKVCCNAVYHPVWVVCTGPTSDQYGQYISVCQYTRLYHMLVHRYVPYQCPIGTLLQTDKVNHGWSHLEDWLCNDWG